MIPDISFSAVIPTFDRGHLIRRAIESALGQSRQPAEIIVIDDGSADDTSARVAGFDTPVRYLYQNRAGAAAARNRGVSQARSEWIAFLDSDDVWLEHHLERMAEAIQATSGVADFYFADALLPAQSGERRLWEVSGLAINGDYELVTDATQWVMMPWPPMLLQASVFKRASYLACEGLWERLRTREDTHLFLKLGLGGSACAVAQCGVQLTRDDAGNRLTQDHGPCRPGGHRMRVLLYQDILSGKPRLLPEHRRELRARLASAHRQLARLSWQEHQPFVAAGHAGRSLLIEPGFLLRFSQSRLDRRGEPDGSPP
jgi:hypothetical protein